jgi:gamma-glutamylcyclotransferase (GGCT)/AIG2-like uncharacterized protein YtfP
MQDIKNANDYDNSEELEVKLMVKGYRIYEFNWRYVVFTPDIEYIGVFRTLQLAANETLKLYEEEQRLLERCIS